MDINVFAKFDEIPSLPVQDIKVGWLCWGLTSQSTIFQSCRDGAIASWVINQYFRGVKCLAQGHNTAAVGLEPRTSRSGVLHSTTEPPRSPKILRKNQNIGDKELQRAITLLGCYFTILSMFLLDLVMVTIQTVSVPLGSKIRKVLIYIVLQLLHFVVNLEIIIMIPWQYRKVTA